MKNDIGLGFTEILGVSIILPISEVVIGMCMIEVGCTMKSEDKKMWKNSVLPNNNCACKQICIKIIDSLRAYQNIFIDQQYRRYSCLKCEFRESDINKKAHEEFNQFIIDYELNRNGILPKNHAYIKITKEKEGLFLPPLRASVRTAETEKETIDYIHNLIENENFEFLSNTLDNGNVKLPPIEPIKIQRHPEIEFVQSPEKKIPREIGTDKNTKATHMTNSSTTEKILTEDSEMNKNKPKTSEKEFPSLHEVMQASIEDDSKISFKFLKITTGNESKIIMVQEEEADKIIKAAETMNSLISSPYTVKCLDLNRQNLEHLVYNLHQFIKENIS